MTPRPATATLTATLAIVLATAAGAEAAAVQSYADFLSGNIAGSTSGPITFTPQSGTSTITTPGSIVLGEFITNPLPTSATLTYANTPFAIDLTLQAVPSGPYPFYTYGSGYGYNPSSYQYQISGVLNGSIRGDGTSTMIATVDSITGAGFGRATTPPFDPSALTIAPQGIAAPAGSTSGITTLTGQIAVVGTPLPAPAPEPSTMAVFGLALAGWACHRRSKARRAA